MRVDDGRNHEDVAKMMRYVQITEATPEQLMVPICCDTFEVMLTAGVITQARGIVYMRGAGSPTALARINFCPWCGNAVDEHEVELLDENEAPDDIEPTPHAGSYMSELTRGQRRYRRRLARNGVPAGTSSTRAKAASAAELKSILLPKMPKAQKRCTNCDKVGHTRPTCTEGK